MKQKATVLWFDRSRGEGMIRVEDGHVTFVHAANIPGKKTWYDETACVYYEKRQEIEVRWDAQIQQWRCETRGHFDAEKWAGLPQERLAFKCDEDGKAINGLFASRGDK